MNGDLQARIQPPAMPSAYELSQQAVSSSSLKPAVDNGAEKAGQTSFKDLLMNSNADKARERDAKKNGGLAGAKTDDEFFKMLQDNVNKDNKRVPTNKLDKDAFLKLFVTQIQHQDPLSPDDSSEMASQLAQFDGLEQMMNVNKTLEKMTVDNQTARAVGLIGFVGKDVQVDGGKLRLAGGKLSNATYKAEKDAPNASLEVRDSSGTVVATQDLGLLKAGEHKVEWDGKSKDGKKIGDGVYTFSIQATDMQGQVVPVDISSMVKITGIDLQDKGGSFYTEIGKVRVEEISAVGNADFKVKNATQEADLAKLNAELAKQAATSVGGVTGDGDPQAAAQMLEEALSAAQAQAAQAQAIPGQAQGAVMPIDGGMPASMALSPEQMRSLQQAAAATAGQGGDSASSSGGSAPTGDSAAANRAAAPAPVAAAPGTMMEIPVPASASST
jgi:flagellar basal-body rod modification protein FlgD